MAGSTPSQPDDKRRQLQHGGGAPLPPPSGTCPDLTGLQQALDAATARVAALEIYTDISAAPRGLIALWAGVADTVPQGWALCDGTNGTPDLRDKFVVGAGDRYALGSSADSGENVGASAPTANNGVAAETFNRDGEFSGGSGQVSVANSVSFGEPVPAHYALAYIMRLDATCCVCYCSDSRPAQPVPIVVPQGTAPDVACRTECAEASACGKAGGHFAEEFSSACV